MLVKYQAILCSTPIGITGSETDVLKLIPPILEACSTPIGITGSETVDQRCFSVCCPLVLNADWHHGVGDTLTLA